MKSKKRKKTLAMKARNKQIKMAKRGYKSNYAKKRAFLSSNGGWGFDYPVYPETTKPWK